MRSNLFFENNIDVLFYFNAKDQYARPVQLVWNSEEYFLGSVQFWYVEHRDSHMIHHYTVGDEHGDYTFELSLETENLTWRLEKATRQTEGRTIGLQLGLQQVAA